MKRREFFVRAAEVAGSTVVGSVILTQVAQATTIATEAARHPKGVGPFLWIPKVGISTM